MTGSDRRCFTKTLFYFRLPYLEETKRTAMKKFLLIIFIIPLFACQNSEQVGTYTQQIRELKSRVDPLQGVLNTNNPKVLSAAAEFSSAKPVRKKATKASKKGYTVTSHAYARSSFASSYTGYCHGRTKKGYPCFRQVKSGLYCWQHGG